MGCFLGCFGAKEGKRRKRRGSRGSPQRQRNRILNVQQENLFTAEQSIKETNSSTLDSQLRNKLEEVEQLSLSPKEQISSNSNITTHEHVLGHESTDFQPEGAISTNTENQQDLKTLSPSHSASIDDGSATTGAGSYTSNLKSKSKGAEQSSPSPKKRVTFNSNVTTYEHISVHDSTDSQQDLKTPSQSYSVSEDEDSVASSVGSYPPNHRYHNARDSDDEAEEYGDSDLDDMDDDDEDYYDDCDEDKIDVRIAGQKVWSESVLTASMESRTGNPSPQGINEEVDSPMVEPQQLEAFTSKTYARDRSNYINSVLNPVGNTTQWKAVKSRGGQQQQYLKKPTAQKENLVNNFVEVSEPPTFGQTKFNKPKNSNQEIAVDASLSTWLSSPEVVTPSGKSFEDRPILGAWTVDELRQVSKSASPRKSPSRSPDETPIIGTVGTYWNHLDSADAAAKHSDSSFKGIPNTTSKYREDKRVNWHSTPFEKRLDRAISRGAAEA